MNIKFFQLLFLFVGFNCAFANTLPQNASIVVGLQGKKAVTLYKKNAYSICHPASITKLMTVYLLLQAVQNHKVTFNTKFTVSNFASKQMPSKLNLSPGEKISVLDCLKALLVKSANDVAVVVAEGLSGSVSAFCKEMNQKAKKLGMTHTHYENPSGVPNKHQVTTARDIAILGLALYKRFFKYWYLFDLKHFQYKKQKYNTHCKILNWYKGADGAKTGFINASGYNLWVTATKTDAQGKKQRLFVVVLGDCSPKYRDFHAAKLLDTYFKTELTASCKDAQSKKIELENKKIVPCKDIKNKKSEHKSKPLIKKKKRNSTENVKNKINNMKQKNKEIIYEEGSIPIKYMMQSTGKDKHYFDTLYSDDVVVQEEKVKEIDFSN